MIFRALALLSLLSITRKNGRKRYRKFVGWRCLVSLCDSLRHQKVTGGLGRPPFLRYCLFPHIQRPDPLVSPVNQQEKTNQGSNIDVFETVNHVTRAKLNE